MKVIKKYTAIKIYTENVDMERIPSFSYGQIMGTSYSPAYPRTEHDSEQEAIEWAMYQDNLANWMIVPLVSFQTWED